MVLPFIAFAPLYTTLHWGSIKINSCCWLRHYGAVKDHATTSYRLIIDVCACPYRRSAVCNRWCDRGHLRHWFPRGVSDKHNRFNWIVRLYERNGWPRVGTRPTGGWFYEVFGPIKELCRLPRRLWKLIWETIKEALFTKVNSERLCETQNGVSFQKWRLKPKKWSNRL